MTQAVVTQALARIAVAVATVVAVFLLFNAFAPRLDRPVAAAVAVGLAIGVSAIFQSRLFRTPLSTRLVLLRAVAAGLVVGLVLSYLQR